MNALQWQSYAVCCTNFHHCLQTRLDGLTVDRITKGDLWQKMISVAHLGQLEGIENPAVLIAPLGNSPFAHGLKASP